MQIVDILAPDPAECPSFVVDTAAKSVDLDPYGAGVTTMVAGGGTSLFVRGDNFVLLSCGYWIPESFTLANYETATGDYPLPIMALFGLPTGAGVPIALFNIGSNGMVRMPFPNYELSLGVFTNAEDNNFDNSFVLQSLFPRTSGIDRPQISMMNVPAALHGDTFKVIPWIKVLHNTPLT